MPSWYLMRPELRLSWRLGVRLGCLYAVDTLLMWTWVVSLYPLHRLECLLRLRTEKEPGVTMLL